MPAKNPKLLINLDLLKPQSNPERLLVKLLRWLFSTGRYILILVEGLVLVAFIARFKLDADLAQRKEEAEQQIPYIESLKPYEVLIRRLQLKLQTIDAFYQSRPDYPNILKLIAKEVPQGVKILNLNLEKGVDKVIIQMSASAQTNTDLSQFLAGLKADPNFSEVTLSGVGLEQNTIRFAITLKSATEVYGGQRL